MSILQWVAENYATLLAIGSFAVGVIVFIKKWVGNIIRYFSVSHDLHSNFGDSPGAKIKEVHDSIKKSHNSLEIRQSISEKYLQIGIFMCEPETGKCIWTNDHLNEVFGLDSSEMKGNGWLQAIDEHDRERVYNTWVYSIKNKIPYSCDYKIKNQRDDSIINVDATAISVYNEENEIICYVGYITKKGDSNGVRTL